MMSADIKKPFEDKLKHKGNSTYEQKYLSNNLFK